MAVRSVRDGTEVITSSMIIHAASVSMEWKRSFSVPPRWSVVLQVVDKRSIQRIIQWNPHGLHKCCRTDNSVVVKSTMVKF